MPNETGDPEKPYMGKNGPRRTPPPGHPDRKKNPRKRAADNVVEGLFGPEALAEAEEARPKREPFTHGGDPNPLGVKKPRKRRQKIRLGSKWTEMLDKMADEGITMEQFVERLSPEELARGQLKNEGGSFVGAPPAWVPAEFHKACIRELMKRGKTLYQENYLLAIEAMTQIATDGRVKESDRIKAAQFVIERIEGKVPERLELGVSEPWQEILAGIVATPGAPMREFHPPDGAPVEGDPAE